MNRSSAQRNIESLSLIVHRLGDLCDEVTFVGGLYHRFINNR